MKKTLLILLILPLSCLGMGLFKSKATPEQERITKLEKQVDGLITITTESGYVVEDVPEEAIPVNESGQPEWSVYKSEPNENLEKAKEGVGLIPVIGDYLLAGLALAGAGTAAYQRKKKQAEYDHRIKTGEELSAVTGLLSKVAMAVEIATTDGATKKAAKKLMTKKQQTLH